MAEPLPPYDPRYLAGIVLFNRGDYFEAHEAWEAQWLETSGPDKKFLQGLIQAAVALCHFCNGNVHGARKLYRSSREYMQPFGPRFWGLDNAGFWQAMDRCFAELLASPDPERRLEPDEELLPTIALEPVPESWPAPEDYLQHD